jgi:uncharacterized damage-inducible protein DinB
MNPRIIEDFETSGAKLRKSIEGLTREDLLWIPPKGAQIGLWSIQQVVFHLMDDELIWTARMKSVIAEDNPKIMGYDEAKFAAELHYEAQDANIAVQILDMNRRQFSILLRKLPESAFTRTGDHKDIGIFTLEQGVTWTAEHLHHHVLYIAMKRAKLGKPLEA